jgi:glycosyltransferase involved in cell wall biosynthesis
MKSREFIILGFNAHPFCSEGVSRITYNTYVGLKKYSDATYLISYIDTRFEPTYKITNERDLHSLYSADKGIIKSALLNLVKSLRKPITIVNTYGLTQRVMTYGIIKALRGKDTCVVFSLFSRPFTLLEKLQYIPADVILTYSPSETVYLSRFSPILSHRIVMALVPIDTDHFSPRRKTLARRTVSEKLGINLESDDIVIGYMGNIFPDRFPPVIFKVLRDLTRKIDIKMVIISPPYEGRSYKPIVEKIIRKFNLSRNVIYMEKFVDYELRPYVYASLDVFLHLYKWKEAPYPFLTALESMSSGVLTVLTNSVEWRWINGSEPIAPIVEIERLEESAQKVLSEIISTELFRDTHLLGRLRERIVRLFSLDKASLHLIKKLDEWCF